MLRITVTAAPERATVVLEGRLSGLWVEEVAQCWKATVSTRDAGSVRIVLHAVTFIDPAGRTLLRSMHEAGASFEASGCMTRAILEEVTQQ